MCEDVSALVPQKDSCGNCNSNEAEQAIAMVSALADLARKKGLAHVQCGPIQMALGPLPVPMQPQEDEAASDKSEGDQRFAHSKMRPPNLRALRGGKS